MEVKVIVNNTDVIVKVLPQVVNVTARPQPAVNVTTDPQGLSRAYVLAHKADPDPHPGLDRTAILHTTLEWAALDQTTYRLPSGSFGKDSDTEEVKSGDGLSLWAELKQIGALKNITEKTANYTPTATDDIILASGTITITLPACANGTVYTIKNAGTDIVTVAGTIDDGVNFTLTQHETITVTCDATKWWII